MEADAVFPKLLALMAVAVLLSCSIILFTGQASADGPAIYQAEIPISASADGALMNYAVKVLLRSGSGVNTAGNIYLNGHANNWPYDIEFTNATGTTVPHWIERFNTTEALVWIKCTYIAAVGTTVYHLSYGHGGNDTSNGSAVFPFFDDFSGDLSKWTSYNTGSPPSSTSNGIYTGVGSTGNVVKLNGNYLANGTRACRFRENITGTAGSVGFEIAANTNNRQVNYGRGFLTANDAGTATNYANLWVANIWHTFEIQVIASTSGKLYMDGALTSTHTTIGTLARPPSIYINNPDTMRLDWYLVRPFTANEPAWAAPGEETLYEIPEPPVASFTNTTASATLMPGDSLQVNFTDTSTNTPTNQSWDLDNDGDFDAYGTTASRSFTVSGSYTICLKVSNSDGSDWENKTITVSITWLVPVASFTNTTASATLMPGGSLQVNFTSTSTNNPSNISWDLNGDGILESYGENVSWNYSVSENIIVRLRVDNGAADWENRTLSITISSPPVEPPPNTDHPSTNVPDALIQAIIGLLVLMLVLRLMKKCTEGT